MNNPLFTLTTIAVALLFSSLAIAEDSVQLPTMVVNSRQESTPGSALNTTHLSEEDLQRSGQRELAQVLRGTLGLSIVQGMKGAPSGLSLRGASGGVGLVNIDGIPLHDAMPGVVNLDLFPAETFGSSDILRGSSAMLDFGRNLGGTINLHSRNSREHGARLHMEGGSFGSLRESATADLGNADHSMNLTAGRDDLFDGTHWADSKQGNSERDDFHAHQLAMHLRDRFSERVQLDSSVYYVNSDNGVDKAGLIRPTPLEFDLVDDPGRLQQEIWLAQSTTGIDLHPQWHSELQLGYTKHRFNAVIGNVLPGSASYPIGFDNQLSLARWKNSHHIWLDAQQKRGFQLNWGGEGLYEQGLSVTGAGGQRGTGSGFANLQGDWDNWQSTLAVRADHFDDYGAHAVYHAGLSWRMTKQLHWFINGGTGYRPPSFNEMLMWPFGNTQLKQEQSIGGEGGLHWLPTDDTQFNVNFFHSRYTGLIKLERTAVPLGLYLINNIPHAQVQGLETQWSTHWNAQLTTGIDYTWTDSKNSDTGKPLPRQPENIARFWGIGIYTTYMRKFCAVSFRAASSSDE